MKVWFTAQEFADAAIEGLFPDLPMSKRGMQFHIDREQWRDYPALCRPRLGKEGGGGFEYHIDVLPLAMRLDYAARFLKVLPSDAQPSIPDDDLTAPARRDRDARLAILAVADRFRESSGLAQADSDVLFARLYNGGKVVIAPWVRLTKPEISSRTLARWRADRQKHGTAALGYDPALSRRGTGVLDRANEGAVKTFILALIGGNQFLSAEHVRRAVADQFSFKLWVPVAGASLNLQREVELPPVRAFQRALAAWRIEHRAALMKLTDPDGYRSRLEFVATGTMTAERLNEVWQIDASPLDALLITGKRPNIYVAIDVYSRRVIILVTLTPRAEGVALLIRKCLMAWGVPERIKTDNGSDFRANATERLFTALDIEVEYSAPYSPRQKGIVERVIGTFQRDFAATLPGFVGHSVADRRVIENRKSFAARLGTDDAEKFHPDLSAAEVAAYADRWVSEIYAHTSHDGLGGRTPHEVAASYAGPVRRLDGTRGLDVLLAPVVGGDGRRKVTKVGITVDGSHYLIGSVMPGTDVFCRHDPADLGRLFVFAADGEQFLGVATCPALAGLDPAATIARVRAEQKALLDGTLKPIRAAMRRIGPRQVADAQFLAQQRPAEVIDFGEATERHSTRAIEAASDAATPIAPVALPPAAAARHQALVADMSKPAAQPLRRESKETRFARALDIAARREAGGAVGDSELSWLASYRETPEFRAMQRAKTDFGDALRL